MNVLEVDANFDSVTRYGFAFRVSKYVLPYFRQRGATVTHLAGNQARASDFRRALAAVDVHLVSGFGHGNSDTFTGQDLETLWSANSYNPSEASGRVIHLVSCGTARRLGRDLVDKGALAYFGYFEEFGFVSERPTPQDLLSDGRADPFFRCDSEIDRLLADGIEAQEVFRQVLELFDAQVSSLISSDSEAASWLLHDMSALCLYGNPAAHV